jgi:hypothetical protein
MNRETNNNPHVRPVGQSRMRITLGEAAVLADTDIDAIGTAIRIFRLRHVFIGTRRLVRTTTEWVDQWRSVTTGVAWQ